MADGSKIRAYLFTVEIDGIETARFQKCEGLEAETYVYEIEEGGLNTTTHKFYGCTRYPNLVLEKGVSDNDELFKWYKETLLEERKMERKNGSIILKDTENKEIKRWNFYRAFPCRWIGPRLETSLSGEYAVERIEIAHEGIEVDNDSVPQLNGSAIQFAEGMKNLAGTSYVWGGNTPADGGMDCSGSIIYILNQQGNNIPDQNASGLYDNYTMEVDGNIRPGDLRFLRDDAGNINHVQTIISGDGARINATGNDRNTRENPGTIDLLEGPIPAGGEIRRLNFKETKHE